MVNAEVILDDKPGLTLKINLTHEAEADFRWMANQIEDDESCSVCVDKILKIAHSAIVSLLRHKKDVY